MNLLNTLSTIAWAETHFGSLSTNRQLPRRDVMRAVRAGLVESAGPVTLCEDDGYMVHPERHREGFRLTPAGRKVIEG